MWKNEGEQNTWQKKDLEDCAAYGAIPKRCIKQLVCCAK